jgi:hypothetical protein
MRLGILDMLALAATLVFAVPVGVFGLNKLLAGETTLGAALVVVAALMVVLPQLLTTPADIPGKLAGKAVGKAVKVPEEEKE